VLAAHTPSIVPFMSDEVYVFVNLWCFQNVSEWYAHQDSLGCVHDGVCRVDSNFGCWERSYSSSTVA
jgi:hypothetical protein